MGTANYTPINHIFKQSTNQSKSPPPTKESEPYDLRHETIEYREPSEKDIDEDVKPYVEVRKTEIEISPELKKVGLTGANPDIFKDVRNPKLPLSDEKIELGLHMPLSSGLRWLAAFAMLILQQSHLTLKKVHGKVVRIVKK